MTVYLATIRFSAESLGRATLLAESIASGECVPAQLGLVPTRLVSVEPDHDETCPGSVALQDDRHEAIPQAGSNTCVCGFPVSDDEVHLPAPARSRTVGEVMRDLSP